ncbi:MAG TPA: hypothetical protein VIE86_06350 [Nitrososphaera sp.]
MASSRGDSVRRHVRNLHMGHANTIPFASYVAGINLGVYFPKPAPTFGRNRDDSTQTKNFALEEFQRQFGKAAFQQFFSGANSGLASQILPRVSTPSREPFGYRVYFCQKCEALTYSMICFPEAGNPLGRAIVNPTPCNHLPGRSISTFNDKISEFDKEKQNKRESQLGAYFQEIVSSFFPKPVIRAIPIDSASAGRVVIKSDTDPSVSISFDPENEGISNYYRPLREDEPFTYTPALMGSLHSSFRTLIRCEWLERATRCGETELDDAETWNAYRFFLDSTFGFVRMCRIESNAKIASSSLFFVYLSNSLPENTTSKRSFIPTILGRIRTQSPAIPTILPI